MRTTNVYKFSELEEDQQKKMRDKIRTMLLETADVSDTADFYKEELESLGFYNVEVSYSLGASQGDGASFTGSISEADAAKLVGLDAGPEAEDNILEIRRVCTFYSHENTVSVDWHDYAEDYNEGILEPFREWVKDKCKAMHRGLESALEDCYNDEAIDSWIECAEPEYVVDVEGNAIPFR